MKARIRRTDAPSTLHAQAQATVFRISHGHVGWRTTSMPRAIDKVTCAVYTHHHKVEQRVFENYASQRRVKDENVIEVVDEMRLAGSKTRFIHEYLKKTTGAILGISIGAVNPMYPHLSELAAQKEMISSGGAFDSENKLLLLPVWLASHWCAAIFDFRAGCCRMFDPMQNEQNYEDIEAKILELLPFKTRKISFAKVSSPRQDDISNCGLYCLIFLECQDRGIPMPEMIPQS